MKKSRNTSNQYKIPFFIVLGITCILLILNILGLSRKLEILPISKIEQAKKKVLKKINNILKDKKITNKDMKDTTYYINDISGITSADNTMLEVYDDILRELVRIEMNIKHKNAQKALEELSKCIDNPTTECISDYDRKFNYSKVAYMKFMLKEQK